MTPPLATLVAELVAIDSVNPALVAGAPGERAIVEFIAGWLSSRGVTVSEVPSGQNEDRPSLLCSVRGWGGGRSLALYAHLDTVGVEGMSDPFDAIVRDGRLHGRGAWDMKGSVAAIMRVAAELVEHPCRGDVSLLLVADEEHASAGTEAVLAELARRDVRPDGCIVTEPSGLQVMLGHRGFATGRLITRGRAAHTARRDEGVDAIAMMARVIVALEDLDAAMHASPAHPLLGHAAVVVSVVGGGRELFTYPAACEAQFVWRTLPGDTQASVTAQIEQIFQIQRSRDARFEASLDWALWRDPMVIDPDTPLVQAVKDAARVEIDAAVCAAPWWTDAALIQAVGIPTVIFGPPGGGIHADDEWVDLAGLERFERILLNVTRSYCG